MNVEFTNMQNMMKLCSNLIVKCLISIQKILIYEIEIFNESQILLKYISEKYFLNVNSIKPLLFMNKFLLSFMNTIKAN